MDGSKKVLIQFLRRRLSELDLQDISVRIRAAYQSCAVLVSIRRGAGFCARTCIRNKVNSVEQTPYAIVTPIASEARMAEITSSIIGIFLRRNPSSVCPPGVSHNGYRQTAALDYPLVWRAKYESTSCPFNRIFPRSHSGFPRNPVAEKDSRHQFRKFVIPSEL